MDWTRVRELREEVGPEAFSEVLALFLQETDEMVERLRADPDPARLADDMHFMKGAALNLGFEELATACNSGESQARLGHWDTVDVAAILACYARSRAALLAESDTLGFTLAEAS
ncbi:MAG: Hpt domain-containing protein [Rhodobacteraceae bacterium]|nr:Hpt domain-containing protein [Paracoccaceae bacterium]